MPFAPAFDQRPLRVKWAGGGRDLVFIDYLYNSSAASPVLHLAITGVGTFEVIDTKKKIGPSAIAVSDGAITDEMKSKLYAWTYTPYHDTGMNVDGLTYDIYRNVVVVNWSLIAKDYGLTTLDFVVTASASITSHEKPGPDPKDSSEVWGAGDILEDPSRSLVAIYSPEFGITDIKHAYNVGPTYFRGTFDECVAWIGGSSGYFVVYSAEDVPPVTYYDTYSFNVSVTATYKTDTVFVTFNDTDKTFDVIVLSPGVYGYSDSTGSSSMSSGHGPEFADWTVTGHVNSDMQTGTLVLDPEDDIVIG